MPYTLEVCVDSTASALAAKRGGADRLELCADLVIGGTTPSLALLRQVKAETGLPVRALLRPRFGDFCYDRYELAQMEQSAAELVEAGADGIVTGVLTPDGVLDVDALRPIYAAARRAATAAGRPVACTLHRACDVCRDPFAALAAAKELGLATILTSGQAASAPQGAELLRQLVEAAGSDVEILVGAGVSAGNLPALAAQTDARAFHLSGKQVLDFGQNLTGFVRFSCRAPKGRCITLKHCEVLGQDGEIYTANLRTARAADTYISDGSASVLAPEFTFHGFRYVQVEGMEAKL